MKVLKTMLAGGNFTPASSRSQHFWPLKVKIIQLKDGVNSSITRGPMYLVLFQSTSRWLSKYFLFFKRSHEDNFILESKTLYYHYIVCILNFKSWIQDTTNSKGY